VTYQCDGHAVIGQCSERPSGTRCAHASSVLDRVLCLTTFSSPVCDGGEKATAGGHATPSEVHHPTWQLLGRRAQGGAAPKLVEGACCETRAAIWQHRDKLLLAMSICTLPLDLPPSDVSSWCVSLLLFFGLVSWLRYAALLLVRFDVSRNNRRYKPHHSEQTHHPLQVLQQPDPGQEQEQARA